MPSPCPVCGTTLEEADAGVCRRCGSGTRPLAVPSTTPTLGANASTLEAAPATLPPAHASPGPDTTATVSDTLEPRSGPLPLSSMRPLPVPGPDGVPFGRYVLTAQIGRGGMGVVYRAWDLELQRTVALKTLIGEESGEPRTPMPTPRGTTPFDNTPASVQRFLREARSAARLRHPNVVSVYDVGQHAGRYFFTMEFVDGVGLDRWLKGERRQGQAKPSFREIAAVLEGAARGLAAAHGEKIVHRDVKPSNILVDARDQAHLGDFGLAKDVEMASTSGLTLSGALLGTPTFMSPEQASGDVEAIGPRSDVFALGSVMYFALAGEVPFAGPTLLGLLRSILEEEPAPPSRKNGSIPRDLEVICLRALEKDPERRYATAEDLAEDLGRFARGEAIHARPRSLSYRSSLWLRRHVRAVAAVVLLAAAVAVALVSWQRAAHESSQAEAQKKRNAARDLLQQADEVEQLKDRENLKAQLPKIQKAIEADGTYALAWLRHGRVEERLGQYDAALSDYGKATELDPTLAEGFYHAGCVRLWKGEADEALCAEAMRDFAKAEKAAQGSDYASLGQAYILELQKKRKDALEVVDRLAAANLRHPDVYFLRAALHSYDFTMGEWGMEFHKVDADLDDHAAALRDLETAIDLDPLSPWGHAVRGRIRFGLGDLEGAREDFHKALDLSPDNHAVDFMAARVDFALGQIPDSLARISKAIEMKPVALYLSFRAALQIYAGDYAAARKDADAAMAKTADYPQARFERAILLAVDGDEEGARKDLQACMGTWKSDLDKFREFDREMQKNQALVRIVVNGLTDFDRIFLLVPARKQALRETQAVLSQTRWFRERVKELSKLRNTDPEAGLLFFDMVRLIEERPKLQEVFPFLMKEFGLTSPLFVSGDVKWVGKLLDEQALLAWKKLYRAKDYLRRASAHYRYGDMPSALADLQEAERMAPSDADVLYALATVESIQGQADSALRTLKRSFDCGWGHPEYTAEDPDFAALKENADFQRLLKQ